MHFIDLVTQQTRIRADLEARIAAVLDHGQYIMGPEIDELENRLAEYVGTRHAVGCASGTDALLLALMALEVGPGDAVFTTPFTFVATAEAIRLVGAEPVFVDIDPVTFNIAPPLLDTTIRRYMEESAAKAARGLPAGRPRGILPVDLFGIPADYDAIETIARRYGLFVIEDAAQSFGATYQERKACSFGEVGCTSFFPAKPLGGYGDGGMCFTNDSNLDSVMRSLRVHGQGAHRYDNVRIGINGRLDTLQAAVLLAKFDIFPDELVRRQSVAERYADLLTGTPDIQVPSLPPHTTGVWAQYSILTASSDHRQRAQDALRNQGIPTAVYYPIPLHRQTAFRDLNHPPGAFPVSEDCASRILSLPMHPYLEAAEQKSVAAILGRL